jgi:ABC-type transport system involved in cytochrome bd biosynthesis fused ATPase/permease subunit
MTTAPQCIPIADHPHLFLRPSAWPTSDPARGKVVEEQTPNVVLKDITLEYKTNRSPLLALDRINLQVKTGEFLCIVGPSGRGKSTLLHLIACNSPRRARCLSSVCVVSR